MGACFRDEGNGSNKEIHRRWYFIRSTMLTRSGYVVIDDNDPAHIIRNNPHVIPPSRQVVRHKVPHQHGASDKITSCDVLRWHIFRTPDPRRLVFRTGPVGKVKFFLSPFLQNLWRKDEVSRFPLAFFHRSAVLSDEKISEWKQMRVCRSVFVGKMFGKGRY